MAEPLVELAAMVRAQATTGLPDAVRAATRRTLLNALGTAVGASTQEAVDVAIAALRCPGRGRAVAPGRTESLQAHDAALVTGIAAHLDDYDDTHLRTVIHPGGTCLATLVALQEEIGKTDADDVLAAYAWGLEAQLRLGVAVSPEHYDAGWHITGTCGAVGAAVTAALLLGLDTHQLGVALGWAVEGGVGNREGFGTMTKAFHVGRAAVNGVRAARDAARGAAGPGDALTGPDGFVTRLADGKYDAEALLGAPGERWELLANTFKPYPCGIVSHPAIEAAESLHHELADHPGSGSVAAITLVCHPLVPELTGNTAPEDGLQARFSTAHGLAAGLMTGAVDLTSYTTDVVRSPLARRLRSIVRFDARADVHRDQATIEVTLSDGRHLTSTVDHARGSAARPLTDDELLSKVRTLADPVLGEGSAESLDAATRRGGPAYLRGLLDACAPRAVGVAARPAADAPPDHSSSSDGDSPDLAIVERLAGPMNDDERRGPAASALEEARGLGPGDSDIHSDIRDRAADLAATLVTAGHPVAVAASAAACAVGELPGAEALRVTARVLAVVDDLAGWLAVPPDRLAIVAAALAHSTVTGIGDLGTLQALGLAATQTTTVCGSAGPNERRVRESVSAGVEAAQLAAHGFTAPSRPLTGRRGLLTLFGAAEHATRQHGVASA